MARGVQSVERLTRDDFKKLLWLASLMESAVRASGIDTDGQLNLVTGAQTPVSRDWSFEVFVLLVIFFLILIGCTCGILAAVLWQRAPRRSDGADLLHWPVQPGRRRRRAAAAAAETPCAHWSTTRLGTNQWELRSTCLTCGVVVQKQDTQLNLERKARREVLASAAAIPATPAEPVAPAAVETSEAQQRQAADGGLGRAAAPVASATVED